MHHGLLVFTFAYVCLDHELAIRVHGVWQLCYNNVETVLSFLKALALQWLYLIEWELVPWKACICEKPNNDGHSLYPTGPEKSVVQTRRPRHPLGRARVCSPGRPGGHSQGPGPPRHHHHTGGTHTLCTQSLQLISTNWL